MAGQILDVRRVAVIGAGVSGVSAAIHLKKAGLNVTVYERTRRAGGIWAFDNDRSKDAAYPSIQPSTGDSPEYEALARMYRVERRRDSPMPDTVESKLLDSSDFRTSFAPPGPCYQVLKNNVSTIEMEMTVQQWKPNTEEFVLHHYMADYIQDSAIDNGVIDDISFNTRVNDVRKSGTKWHVAVDQIVGDDECLMVESSVQQYDAVVVATGHYHACNVPDIDGLADWKRDFPQSVQHSKLYRSSEAFKGQNVLLIGSGVSSIDIARDLGNVARTVYQSSRGGPYDLPSHLLPDNAARVGGIKAFNRPSGTDLANDASIPGTVTLQSGEQLCGIHHVIVCTGYHVSFPFMRQYHRDGKADADVDESCLSASGQQTHNLHKDIWYIPDPTLAFIGVPYHVATFSCFEFQAMALAAVFSGRVSLPRKDLMRGEYNDRLRRKGAGRTFHSLKGRGDEIAYVNELVDMVALSRVNGFGPTVITGHTQRWHEAYLRRVARQKILFSKTRDPYLDRTVLDLIEGC